MPERCGTPRCPRQAVVAFTACEQHERLLDAAPALLEALEAVDEWHDLIKQNYPEMFRTFKQARAAIALAKGETR